MDDGIVPHGTAEWKYCSTLNCRMACESCPRSLNTSNWRQFSSPKPPLSGTSELPFFLVQKVVEMQPAGAGFWLERFWTGLPHSGKSKGGLSKGGLGPKGANWAKKGPFGAISALPPWLWGAEELVPIGPEKAPIGPEKVPICPEKARFRGKDFPPIFSENLGLKPPFVSPPLDFPNPQEKKEFPLKMERRKKGEVSPGTPI